MTTSHKALIKEYFDLYNEFRWKEVIDFRRAHFTDDFVIEVETFVDHGFGVNKVDGKAVVALYPYGMHPANGKLKDGDEIVSIEEDGRKFETLADILYGNWGWNTAENVHIQARRDGETFTVDITPVINRGGDWPYPFEKFQEDFDIYQKWHAEQCDLEYMLEEGNRVACFCSVSGLNKKYRRVIAYTQAWIFEFRDDKIARFLEVHNTLAEFVARGYGLIPPEEVEDR